MSSILSFDIISVAVPDHQIFLCILASAADAAGVNPNGIKTLLVLFLRKDQEVYQEILLIISS